MVPVARFSGSRLASGPSPSPYQQGATARRPQQGGTVRRPQLQQGTSSLSILDFPNEYYEPVDDTRSIFRTKKAARLSSDATIGAAIVEAEDSLETEVCFPP